MTENGKDYVLLTAARNEESYIEDTIQSVVAQKPATPQVGHRQRRLDGQDRSNRPSYESKTDFIVYARRDEKSDGISFARKVFALRHGYGMLRGLSYQFIGNLDADITFDETYYERLIEEFQKNPKLGIAGGMLYEESNGKFMPRYLSEMRYVPGGSPALQAFLLRAGWRLSPEPMRGRGYDCRGNGPNEGVGDKIHPRHTGVSPENK